MGRQALLPPRARIVAGGIGPEAAPVADLVPRRQITVAVVGLVLVGVALVVGHTSLFGDGSFYFLRTIQSGSAYSPAGREILNTVREAPLLVGVAVGITNLRLLSFLLGVGFVLFPLLVWAVALQYARLSRVGFCLVAIVCGTCVGTMTFFSVGELMFAFPLVVLVAVLLAQEGPWSRSQVWVVIGASLILSRSHEAVALCAVLLGLHAVLRAWRGRDRGPSLAVAALSAVAVASAVVTSSTTPNTNSDSFFFHIRTLSPASTLAILVGGVLLAAGILLRSHAAPRPGWSAPAVVLFVAAAVVFAGDGVVGAVQLAPLGDYPSRGLCMVAVLSVQAALGVLWWRTQRRTPASSTVPSSSVPSSWAVAFLVVLIAVPVTAVPPWTRFLDEVRSTAVEREGVVSVDEAIAPAERRFVWTWTSPIMSVILRPPGARGVIENDTDIWQPFPPADAARQLPVRYSWR